MTSDLPPGNSPPGNAPPGNAPLGNAPLGKAPRDNPPRAGEPRDSAGVIAPPPILFAIPFLAAILADRIRPFPILPNDNGFGLAVVLTLAGLGLIAAGGIQFRRARTAMIPIYPSTTIVTTGPFRFSRNPFYLGMVLIYVGVAFWVNSLWPLLFLPIALFGIQRGVIYREEAYLERKFGAEYLKYKERVRRWL